MKLIIVPKTKEAEYALNFNIASDDDLDIVSLSQKELDFLWSSNIFKLINDISPEILIDDFEDAHISDKKIMERAIEILNKKEGYDYFSVSDFAEKLIVLFQSALIRDTSIQFYF